MEITLLNDKYDPETTAMLQAFYSRNHKSIKVRLDEMGEDSNAVKKGLEKWYVGYGHRSIGQCGSFTIFIENVSILAAKVIQDSQLYNGQETSTRYIDFSVQEMYDYGDSRFSDIQKKWLDFYTENHLEVLEHVAKTYNLNLDDKVEYKTAKARTFDILRGFLPAGCKTQLSWHTTFTHAADRLVQLSYHPLQEVRDIAAEIIAQCKEQYPFAFAGIDKDLNRYKEYYTNNSEDINYFIPDDDWVKEFEELNRQKTKVDIDVTGNFLVDPFDKTNRPKGLNLCRGSNNFGEFNIEYLLDYGSFRDIQRHRSCHQMLPVLTTRYGFHDWYINALPKDLQKKAKLLILSQTLDIEELNDSFIDLQYVIPLGFNVACYMAAKLPSLVYIAEIRSSKTVHPTLREIAKVFADHVREYVDVIYDDQSEDEIDLRRGTQDIVEK